MLSVIIPFYNEKENLPILIEQLSKVLTKIKENYEIILVDDGSDKNSKFEIRNSKLGENLKLITHRKRFGKGRALETGLNETKGDIIVFMDADLQDDPQDLPRFIDKLREGYDFVNGVRTDRKENILIKFYSRLASLLLKFLLGSPYTDINCGYKAFKRHVLDNFNFYGNNFRFFPLSVYYEGFRVTEIPVKNHPRIHGKSKYGVGKVFIGILDTLTTYFIYKFSERPLHFFGPVGGTIFLIGFVVTLVLVFERIFYNVLLYRRPALTLAILLIIVGIQIVMTGIIGELIVYLNRKNKK